MECSRQISQENLGGCLMSIHRIALALLMAAAANPVVAQTSIYNSILVVKPDNSNFNSLVNDQTGTFTVTNAGGSATVTTVLDNGGFTQAIAQSTVFTQSGANLNFDLKLDGPAGGLVEVLVATSGQVVTSGDMYARAALSLNAFVGGQTEFPLQLVAVRCTGLEAGCFDETAQSAWNHAALSIWLRPNVLYSGLLQASVSQLQNGVGSGSAFADPIFSLAPGNPGYTLIGSHSSLVSTGAVPEPSSWAMLIAGFGLIGAAARRQRPMARAAG